MHSFQDAVAEIQQQRTQIAGFGTLLAAQRKQIADLLAGTTVPTAVQQQIDSLFDELQQNDRAIVDAINSGTAAQGVDPTASTASPQPAPPPDTSGGTTQPAGPGSGDAQQ